MYYIRVFILLFLGWGMVQSAQAGTLPQLPAMALASGTVHSHVLPDTTIQQKVAAFKRTWHRKINKLDKQIAKAQKKMQRAGEEGKENLASQVEELKAKRGELQQQVDEAGDKSAEQWDDFKADVAQKYDTLESRVRDLFTH